jgi:oxalate decarboxylase/phosphoglucose isomerase-like protein (cupin superfamily)
MVYIPEGVYHSTVNVGWEPLRLLAVYSPPGPEAAELIERPQIRLLCS